MKNLIPKGEPAVGLESIHFRTCATAFLAVVFFGFLVYRVAQDPFRDNLNVPVWKLRGLDFRAYHVFASDLLEGKSPYIHDTLAGPNPYPPLYSAFVACFAWMDVDSGYIVWTVLSVAAFLAAIVVTTRLGDSPVSLMALAGIAYVLSQTYPVPFVWERGTPEFFILLAMVGGLVMLARRKYIAAVVLLTIATHFKLYPLILGAFVLLRGGWRWAMVFAGTVLLAFFVLGMEALRGFLSIIGSTMEDPERWIWPGNHSIKSFELWCVFYKYITPETGNMAVLVIGGGVVLLFCYMLWGVYRQRALAEGPFSAAEASMLGMAFSLMTLLPTFSHDYKLAQQFVPLLALMVNAEAARLAERRTFRILYIALAMIVASLYLPRFGEVPRTPQLLVAFGLYTALAELSLRSRAKSPDSKTSPKAGKAMAGAQS